ncbi:hypothetical protein FJ444_19515 [Aestuariibacter sp. GS-14]|uniref:hypothetical protein n=1 Tax=Aestuariibacter sp. GS-14 TaxID=2590670 RepID=UPI001126D828|nr:hypothetical protein [Aestuariibacter sp. GS-14]TPV54070.1 hypothetical protein FJ444_19515 [Aestuariibacter sp. GS-14]
MVYQRKRQQHQRIDQQSQQLHLCIAQKVLAKPELMDTVTERLNRRYQDKLMGYGSYLHWQAILAEFPNNERFIAAMTSNDSTTTRLRRATIFTGILSEEERNDCLAAPFE